MNLIIEKILSFIISIPTFGMLHYVWLGTHKEMMRTFDSKYKKLYQTSFSYLREKMKEVDWYINPSYPTSLFCKSQYDNYYIHADIVIVGGNGYQLTLIGLIRLRRHIRRFYKKHHKAVKPEVIWK